MGGHTVGRGMNGQRSRSGGNKSPRKDFEGGQNPLSRRLPKLRGFKVLESTPETLELNLSSFKSFVKGDKVTIDTLKAKGLIAPRANKNFVVKVLGTGKLETSDLVFSGIKFTASAKSGLESAGCTFE